MREAPSSQDQAVPVLGGVGKAGLNIARRLRLSGGAPLLHAQTPVQVTVALWSACIDRHGSGLLEPRRRSISPGKARNIWLVSLATAVIIAGSVASIWDACACNNWIAACCSSTPASRR